MLYKTMVLELLRSNPVLHRQLKRKRLLLATLNRCARELKTSHEALKQRLRRERPHSSENQIAGEALEIALKELEDHFSADSRPNEALSLAETMAFSGKPTPNE